MEQKLKNKVKEILLQILAKNRELGLGVKEIGSLSKALILTEYFDNLKPTGEFKLSASETLSDGHNKTVNSYFLSLNKHGLRISSFHSFAEGYGVSYGSHTEETYPDEQYKLEDLLPGIDIWNNNFIKTAIYSIQVTDNLRGVKIIEL